MGYSARSGPVVRAVEKDGLSSSGVVGISVGAAALVVVMVGAAWVCYRRGRGGAHKKMGGDRQVTLRRPTAVKNPQAHSHYLKKSPSPTGARTPPGGKSPTGHKSPPGAPRSPGSGAGPGGGLCHSCPSPRTASPAHQTMRGSGGVGVTDELGRVSYVNEHGGGGGGVGGGVGGGQDKDKPSTPSKEELELNERNLAKESSTAPSSTSSTTTTTTTTTSSSTTTRLGKLHFKLRYNFDKNALVVTIVKCTDLPAKDPGLTSSDPYVKLQLLPDKQHKVKTRVLRKTLSPTYDEDFTFYGINYSQLQNITLHFIVLSFDRYSRDDIIGEVVAPLAHLDLANTEASLSLTREISPRALKVRSQGRGELLVSLCHQPAANRLTVVVLKARNLPKMDITGLSDPYVKIYLLYNGQRVAKKKTHVKKRTLNPVFNESFVFDLPVGVEGLDSISLEFLLLDWDRVTKNEVIGRLELGGTRATACGSASHHWSEVVTSPRRQIAEWHKLRE